MTLYTMLLFFISCSAALHEGLGSPVIGQSEASTPGSSHRVRTKRCSCNNQLDFECHYFCHLDIIWVNTPSKMTVYGLGSPIARRRRSTDRCLCSNPADRTCNSFCVHSPKNTAAMMKSQSESMQKYSDLQAALESLENAEPVVMIDRAEERADILTFLRSLVRAKFRGMKKDAPPSKKGSKAHKPGYS